MFTNVFTKRLLIVFLTVAILWGLSLPVSAMTETEARTVKLNDQTAITLTPREVVKGKTLFKNTCATCHLGGTTLTNPNVGLDPESLSLANPPRNTIVGLVDYMKNPTTFDGIEEIYETHPSIRSSDIFPTMRGLTNEDLKLIAAYILYAPNVRGIGWGGGKIYY